MEKRLTDQEIKDFRLIREVFMDPSTSSAEKGFRSTSDDMVELFIEEFCDVDKELSAAGLLLFTSYRNAMNEIAMCDPSLLMNILEFYDYLITVKGFKRILIGELGSRFSGIKVKQFFMDHWGPKDE